MNCWKKKRTIFWMMGALYLCMRMKHSVYAEETESVLMRQAVKLPISSQSFENPQNPYETLKVPTQIKRIGDYYFLTDCYHDQVLYTKTMGTKIKDWKVMTADVEQPHAIAGDGTVYLVTDTENNRVQIFEWKKGRFQNTGRLENIGKRPHYIIYEEETQSFYIWSSLTGEMYIAKHDAETENVYLSEIRKVEELDGHYVRSFTIIGEDILFPSGSNGYMILADKKTLEVKERYPVPSQIAGMAYVLPIGNYFYITVSSDQGYDQSAATMIRTKDLPMLAYGEYEDVFSVFKRDGVPYYIDRFNGMYYMTSGNGKTMVWHFNVSDNKFVDVGAVY